MSWPLWVRIALSIRAHGLALEGDVPTAHAALTELDGAVAFAMAGSGRLC
jgi:hypothetical protein